MNRRRNDGSRYEVGNTPPLVFFLISVLMGMVFPPTLIILLLSTTVIVWVVVNYSEEITDATGKVKGWLNDHGSRKEDTKDSEEEEDNNNDG